LSLKIELKGGIGTEVRGTSDGTANGSDWVANLVLNIRGETSKSNILTESTTFKSANFFHNNIS
jgi:hypothetical protein